jgi:hypothetical protein
MDNYCSKTFLKTQHSSAVCKVWAISIAQEIKLRAWSLYSDHLYTWESSQQHSYPVIICQKYLQVITVIVAIQVIVSQHQSCQMSHINSPHCSDGTCMWMKREKK